MTIKVRLVALVPIMSMAIAACGSDGTLNSPNSLSPLPAISSTSNPASVATSLVAVATTTLVPVPPPPPVTTVAPTTPPPTALPATLDPHGVPIEVGCIRSNIDFAAVRAAPGVSQPELGRIPPATCNVQVYATGTDGRINWLEVGVGGIFGWSAESNFVQSTLSLVAAPAGPPVATTSPPPGSLPPGWGSAAIDLQAQTVFGIHVGPVSTEQMIGTVSAQMGPPTYDTGWYTIPYNGDFENCLANQPSRVVHWGDLSIALWQGQQTDSLWSWSVGDPRVSGQGDRQEPKPNRPIVPAATGLHTAEGIGIDSSIDSVTAAYGQQFQFFPEDPGAAVFRTALGDIDPVSGTFVGLDSLAGYVAGLGSALAFC